MHLEIVDNKEASTVAHVIRRFIAKRTKPTTLYSDNASEFEAAAPLIASLYPDGNFKWHWSTPRSPWRNGVFERLIGLIKAHLRRTFIQNGATSSEAFATILAEVERIIN